MWPLFSAAKRQPATAPRPRSQIYGRVPRTRTSVSAVTEADVADDIGGHAGAPRKQRLRSSGSAVTTTTAPQTSAGKSAGSKGGRHRAASPQRSDTVIPILNGGIKSPSRSTVEGDTYTATPSLQLLVVEGDALDPAEDEDPRAAGCGDYWNKEESKTPTAPHEILRYSAKTQQSLLHSRMERLEWARERIHFTQEDLLQVPCKSERFGTLMTRLRAQMQKLRESEADLARMKAALGEHPSDPDDEDVSHNKDASPASPSLPRVEGDTNFRGVDVQRDELDSDELSLELGASNLNDDTALHSHPAVKTEEPSFQGGEEGVLSQTSCQEDDNSMTHSPADITGTAFEQIVPPTDDSTSHSPKEMEGDMDISGTAIELVVPIGADAEVIRNDDVLPPNITTSTDSPPSGGRESFKSILTRSGLDHKPVSLIQATAAAPPRQTTSPSCAPSLMAPANNITTPMTGGQGKGAPAKAPPRQSNGRSSGRSKHKKKKGKHAVPAIALPHQPQRRSSQQSALAPTAILPRSHVVATDGPRPPSHRQLWSPATLTNQSSIKGGARANRTTSANGDGQAMLELKQQVTRLLLTNSRLRQENSRLTSELADTRMAVQVSPHNREDAAANDDDDATVATSNLTDVDVCETVPDWDDDGDEDVTDDRVDDAIDGGAPVHRSLHQGSPSNIQSVHAAPSITFELVSTGTEDIRLIETNNQRKPQDVEGLPLEPKRKRRRRRKRKRPRRRKGKANKRRPGHSPVTPPRRQDNARRQAAKTHESFIKEFRAFIYSNAAKYCPASGFDTNWHRKGIG
ncbi:hypothetical protein THAOC_17530 [Thalassiosira oceanica]|uniref:Uncharacterized protein n=1 Tax=Thalassiosira oceanica TaxID=159749 RepID=K0S9C2_THAOC|nr:hypothetical protein THAOC_17530 [Thalassiosira oceanica]|eukprot:EJK61895.1 hypothetical protein THAOC_17530 [Thalassiosira oceanica]